MRLRFLAVSVVLLTLCAGNGYSQTFTGLLDGYWSYNTNTPNLGGNRFNDYRAFDTRDQTFSLSYGEIAVDYKPMNVGFRVDIGFGDTADVVHSVEPGGQDLWRYIQQAYITGTSGRFTVDFGKWVTPIGAEVIETKDNWNYTRGLLFTWAIPFYHFGAKGTYVVSEKATIAGYVVNGWNNVVDPNTAKSVGFVGIFTPAENLTLTTNYLVGRENPNTDDSRQLFDAVVSYAAVPDRFWLMANYDYGMDREEITGPGDGPRVVWQGLAAYAKARASDHLTTAVRYEYFSDRNGFTTGNVPIPGTPGRPTLQSFTATAQIPWQEITLWAEYRRDWSKLAGGTPTTDCSSPLSFCAFIKTDELGASSFVDNQNTFTLGLTYSFTRAR